MTKKKHCIKHSDKCLNHETRQIRKTRKTTEKKVQGKKIEKIQVLSEGGVAH